MLRTQQKKTDHGSNTGLRSACSASTTWRFDFLRARVILGVKSVLEYKLKGTVLPCRTRSFETMSLDIVNMVKGLSLDERKVS